MPITSKRRLCVAPTVATALPNSFNELAGRLRAGRLRPGDISQLFSVAARWVISVPLMLAPAVCGFPSPADDYMDRPLDFNELLIVHPAATFAARVTGESMIDIGIFPNDIAIVDRAETVVDGSIVLALLGNEFTIKRYRRKGSQVWLQAENRTFRNIPITEESAFEVWGVITRCIRML